MPKLKDKVFAVSINGQPEILVKATSAKAASRYATSKLVVEVGGVTITDLLARHSAGEIIHDASADEPEEAASEEAPLASGEFPI